MRPNLTQEAGLPANLDAEKTILGAILLDNAAFFEASEQLAAADFSLDSHGRIFSRMAELMAASRAVDIVTLANELGRCKEVEAVGGVAYLASLTEGLPMHPAIADYIRIVKDKSQMRSLMGVCSAAIARAADQSETALEVIESVDAQLLGVAGEREMERSLEDQEAAAFKEIEDEREGRVSQAIPTTIQKLDDIIGGYKRRRLYIVGGRPSMGKTSLMIEAAVQHCSKGVRTRLISLEMEAEELLQRIYAAVSDIPYGNIANPVSLSSAQWEQLKWARKLVSAWPLEIDSRADQDIDGALARARLSCRRRKTGFLAADYAQIFHFKEDGKMRHQEISDIGKKLRNFAKTEDIPVMLLSSLTEIGDRNPNQRPSLSSLRGSGDLAFHADVAILIHREREEDGAGIKTDSELIVVKQRGGRTGVCYATYNTNSLLFEDRN